MAWSLRTNDFRQTNSDLALFFGVGVSNCRRISLSARVQKLPLHQNRKFPVSRL